jgi:hypothetical protein
MRCRSFFSCLIGLTAWLGCNGLPTEATFAVDDAENGDSELVLAQHEGCFTTNINGPTYLTSKQSYTWTATTTCGNPSNIDHEWYRIQGGTSYGPYSGSSVNYTPYTGEYTFKWALVSTTTGCPPPPLHSGLCIGDPLSAYDTLNVTVCTLANCDESFMGGN